MSTSVPDSAVDALDPRSLVAEIIQMSPFALTVFPAEARRLGLVESFETEKDLARWARSRFHPHF